MEAEQPDPRELLPLTLVAFRILLALAGGEQHGYSIMQEINQAEGGRLRIGPTSLYRSIKQLLADGLLVESDERPDPEQDDQRRRYYRLTPFGRSVALAEERRLAELVAVAQMKLRLNGESLAHQGDWTL
jgi:DNA-binding PadR family transcriptional regulator